MDTYLYLMCYRYEALVVSHLAPQDFARYMAVGPEQQTSGREMFIEVDRNALDAQAFSNLHATLEQHLPHPDGRPKKSSYVAIYRVLEHLPIASLGTLHLVTRDGQTLSLQPEAYDESIESQWTSGGPNGGGPEKSAGGMWMYVEMCPTIPRVVSRLAPRAFGRWMTDTASPVSVPRLFYCDTYVEREPGGRLASYLPYRDHGHIANCLDQLAATSKEAKTVDRQPPLVALWRTIRSGFFVADSTDIKYYRYPSKAQLDDQHHTWWRSAQVD